MGEPINFEGSNVVMRAPEGAENVQDMHVYRTHHSCVSCWTFSPEELAEINQTGRIFLSVLAGGQQPPVYVGSESKCLELMADFGTVWSTTASTPPPSSHVAPDAAARLERILRLGRSMKWTVDGAPALQDEDTAVALGELFQIFFQDAVDRALATTEGSTE